MFYPAISGPSFVFPFDILTKQCHPLLGCLMYKKPAYFKAHLT